MSGDLAPGNGPGQPTPAAPTTRDLVRDTLGFAVAILAYNVPLAISSLDPVQLWGPSPDTLVLFYLMLVLRRRAASLGRVATQAVTLLAIAAAVLWILRILDSVVAAIYDRPFALYLDVHYTRDLVAYLDQIGFVGLGWLTIAGALGVLAGIVVVVWRLCRGFVRAASTRAGAAAMLFVAAAAILGSALASLAGGGVPRAVGPSSLPRAVLELRQLGARAEREAAQEADLEVAAAVVASVPKPLDRLDADLFLFIVESYGYTVLSNPEHFALIQDAYARIDGSLRSAGYQIYSHFLDSPAFGGNSWLADATLATGVRIVDQEMYDHLLASDVPTVAGMLREVGFHTVNAQPANVTPWPEGDYFGFDARYYYHDYGFRGPALRWAPMTDQFAVDFIHRQEVALQDEQPLFVQYILISSHYPFNLIPRYLADWNALGDGSLYHQEESLIRIPRNSINETGLALGFMTAINYTLRVIEEYLVRFISERDALIVIVGDHQPWSGISGRGQPRSVPIHVVSRRGALLEPFVARGYTAGMIPRQPLPHPGMEHFVRGLLKDFSSVRAPVRTALDDPDPPR